MSMIWQIVFGMCLLVMIGANPVQSAATDVLGGVEEFNRTDDGIDIRTTSGAVVRIQVLRSDLFRIWIGPQGELVDEGSHVAPIVLERDLAPVAFRVEPTVDRLVVSAADFVLDIRRSPLTFALYRSDRSSLIWRELKPVQLGEEGSYQTLSSSSEERFFGGGQQNGSFEFKGRFMEISYSGWEEGDRPSPAPFYMSNTGYGVLRNTWTDGRYDFFSADYLTTTHQEHRFDAYYFVGESINQVLDLYTWLTGRAALLPRWAFEYGDADCYNDGDNVEKPGTVPDGWSDGPTGTTPDVITTVAAKYREHDMPGGWILPNDGYGCGYTDLAEVVKGLRSYGFQTGLWTENGVEKIAREVGQAGTRAQKLDVAWTGKGYQFALDANHDAARGILDNSDSRPFVWTVMGWAGIQRYAVTWTGDQSGSWDFIRWHIPTLIGSGLSGMVYSTGDVDGIFGGSPETFTRDLQWKCFTPVLMGMSGWSKAERKHPWWFEEPYRSINRKYLKLKMRLMPYMYTLARQAEQSGAPLVRGLMWDHPQDPRAFSEEVKYQFFLGQDLLVAPVYRSQAASGGWRENVYLPQGDWIDYWDGSVSSVGPEGLLIDYPVTIEKLPLFVRAGAILPMYPEALYDGQTAKDVLTLDIYPADYSEFTLYEDDGHTRAYQQGEFTVQKFSVSRPDSGSGDIDVNLGQVEGAFKDMHETRVFQLQVHTPNSPRAVMLDGRPLSEVGSRAGLIQESSGWYFDAEDRHGVVVVRTDTISVRIDHHVTLLTDRRSRPPEITARPAGRHGDDIMAPDKLLVVGRPTEEPGYGLEQAFDGNPDSWFRTVRDQSVSYGPHEFVIFLKERRLISGFQIAPRNDKWWHYGNVYDYEIYLSDVNGQWGEPVIRDTLGLCDSLQTVEFEPVAGSLVRFRVFSTHDMKEQGLLEEATDGRYNAHAPMAVSPVTISEFRLLEYESPDTRQSPAFLSDQPWSLAECSPGAVRRHHPADDIDGAELRMNGLLFPRGLSVQGDSRIDFCLPTGWQSLRVEAGLDDRCQDDATVRFQVYGDDQLLYQSALLTKASLDKFEVDIRGVKVLSLRTVEATDSAPANWASPTLLGLTADCPGR